MFCSRLYTIITFSCVAPNEPLWGTLQRFELCSALLFFNYHRSVIIAAGIILLTRRYSLSFIQTLKSFSY